MRKLTNGKINYLLPEESAEMTLNQVKSLRQIEGRLRKVIWLEELSGSHASKL